MKATFDTITFKAEVLVVTQPTKHHLLKGTVGHVDSYHRGAVRVITKFPSGLLAAIWQPYESLVLLPERSKDVNA